MLRGWGGQSNRIFVEAMGAKEKGHEIAFAIPHDSKLADRARSSGMIVWDNYVMKPPAQFWKFLPDLRRFLKDVKQWKPDLIHLHGSQDTWLAVIASKFLGKDCPPLIRTKHNIFDWKMHGANKWLYRNIDAYLSISTFIDDQLESYEPARKQPRTRIFSVPDLEGINNAEGNLKNELKSDDNQFVWISTGRMRSEKGFDILLKAFAEVLKERSHARLVLAGSGSDREILENQARDLGLLEKDRVRFLGFRQDVPALLKSSDAYVLASRSEGLGTAILEALAAPLPVVATRVGGIPDSVRHEETGLLVPSEDAKALSQAMIRMMDEADLRESLSKRAQEMIQEEFTREVLVDQTLTFYEKVLQSHHHG